MFDDESLHLLADRAVRQAREAGALGTLSAALVLQVPMLTLSGELAHAAELSAEQAEITRLIGARPLRRLELLLAAWKGDEAAFTALFTAAVPDTADDGDVIEVGVAHSAHAVLQNGLGSYPAALDAAEWAAGSRELSITSHSLIGVVEAGSRADPPERAATALERLSGPTPAGPSGRSGWPRAPGR